MTKTHIKLLLTACFIFSLPLYGDDSDDSDDDDDYEQEDYVEDDEGPIIWVGPGIYYGLWFGSEYEYNNWSRDHYHEYQRNHRGNGNRHGDGHHGDHGHGGGGHGHGGGGHGGGGHGGGGHHH